MTTLKQTYQKEYQSLLDAIRRCHDENVLQFSSYGARGITVYEEWRGKEGFGAFLAHIGPKPTLDLTLDRIDNDKGYFPGNVRWATRIIQNNNRRPRTKGYNKSNVLRVDVRGEMLTYKEAALLAGVSHLTIRNRIARGLTGEQLIKPVNRRRS